MAKLILHLGMHRTGSTAIQSSLAANDGNGFLYPRIGERPFRPHHEDALDQIFGRERFGTPASSDLPIPSRVSIREQSDIPMSAQRLAHLAEDGKEKIRQAAMTAGDRPVILSGEGAYRYFSIKDLHGLHDFAQSLFDDVSLFVYVRNPFDLTSSIFHNQIIGHRQTRFKFKYSRYDLLKKFDEVFGSDRVHLWRYDTGTFPDGDVVQHFCEKAGLPRLTSSRENVTSSRPAVSAVYRLNRILAGNGEIKEHKAVVNLIRTAFGHHQWPKFRLSPRLVRPLVEARASDLDWIEERMDCCFRVQPEDRDHDVRSEDDLLRIEPLARSELLELGGGAGSDAARRLQDALAD